MKSTFKSAILLFSGLAILATPAMAVTTTNGDLLVGFYQIINGSVQANTYIFDLGAASLYRESTLNNVAVSSINTTLASVNINADLTNAFGSTWANSGTVYWTIFGGADQTTLPNVLVNGDVAKSSYFSVPVTTYTDGTQTTTAPTGISGSPRSTLSAGIEAVRLSSNGTGTNVGNAAGAKIATSSSLGTLEDFMPPAQGYSSPWNVNGEKRGLFGAGTVAGSTGLEGALDVYRYLNSTTVSGVDLTSAKGTALASGNAGLGVGQYIGTFTINSAGDLGLGQISAVPEPSGALALGLIGTFAGLGYRSRRSNKLA